MQRTFVPLTETFPEDLRRFGWVENTAPHADALYIDVAKGILRWRDGQVSPLPVAQRDLIHVLHGDTGPHYAYVQNGPLFRIGGDAAVPISDDPRLTRSQLRFCARTTDARWSSWRAALSSSRPTAGFWPLSTRIWVCAAISS